MGLCSVWWEVAGPSHHLMTGDSFETQEGGHGCCSWHIWKAECICNRKQLVKVKQALPRENSFAFLQMMIPFQKHGVMIIQRISFPERNWQPHAPWTSFRDTSTAHPPDTSPSQAGKADTAPQWQVLGSRLKQTCFIWWNESYFWVVSSGPQSTYRLDWWFKTRWFKVKLLKGTPRSLPPSSSQGKDAPLLSPAPQAKLCRSRDLEQWGPAAIDRLDLLFTQKTSIL